MKPTFEFTRTSTFCLLFLSLFLFLSCNKEELFVEDIVVVEEDDTANEDTDTNVNTNVPCDFTLNNIQPNSTVIINCIMDLGGETINLPANVTIQYEGGDIINGTLIFSEDSVISGELLNSTFVIEGSVPQLKDPAFTFIPKRWGIVEGVVSDDVALNNRNILQNIIYQTKSMGIKVFNIDALDAYFRIELNYEGRTTFKEDSAINIPSDFHLKMSDNTFLRVQPNDSHGYTLIKLPVSENVIISGGHLVGDRFEHAYTPFTDEFGVSRNHHTFGQLMYIIGSENVVVDNVHFSDPTGDAIVFHGEGLRNNDGSLKPGYSETNNVIIKNSTILRARRNGISFLDGRNITIDNCVISDTGLGEQAYDADGNKIYTSAGADPRRGIDLEAIRYKADDGSLRRTALNEDITIKNSTFTGNALGDIVVFTANDVTIENNFFDYKIGSFASDNIIVRNNTFKSREPYSFTAISINTFVTFTNQEDAQGEELNHHWTLENNTIKEYGKGMAIKGRNHEIKNNTIEDCTYGVFLVSDLSDTVFSGNTITSSLEDSHGYKNLNNSKNINNVYINNEIISVQERPISLTLLNYESNLSTSQISFKGCSFNTTNPDGLIKVRQSKNITFDSNTSNVEFDVSDDSENIILTNNTVNN